MLAHQPRNPDASESGAWDAVLHALDGDLLQSWRWGAFKQCHGWMVDRIHVQEDGSHALAQVLFRKRGPFRIAYLPRGPVTDPGGVVDESLASALLAAIDESCARHGAHFLVIEPHRPLPDHWTRDRTGFVTGPESFQTPRTVTVPLAEDGQLLAQMRKDTRYNVNYARRQGTVVQQAPPTIAAITAFCRVLQDTSERNRFGIHPRAYYEDFLRVFTDHAVLLFAVVDGVITAGLIAAQCGTEARSMYAGSLSPHRTRGDAALLRVEAMRWARERGCTRYDLGGIAPEGPSTSRRSNLSGVNQFKTGFGGEIVAYPPTVERRYHPGRAWLIRRLNSRFRSAE